MLVLYFSCSLSFRICKSLRPSWPIQISVLGNLCILCIIVICHENVLYFFLKVAQFLIFVRHFLVKYVLSQDLGIVCICLALSTRLSASLTAITATLVASITACFIACIMIWSVAILSCFTLAWLEWVCLIFHNLAYLVWDIFPFTSEDITHIKGW